MCNNNRINPLNRPYPPRTCLLFYVMTSQIWSITLTIQCHYKRYHYIIKILKIQNDTHWIKNNVNKKKRTASDSNLNAKWLKFVQEVKTIKHVQNIQIHKGWYGAIGGDTCPQCHPLTLDGKLEYFSNCLWELML